MQTRCATLPTSFLASLLALTVTILTITTLGSSCAGTHSISEMTHHHHAIDYIEFTVLDLAQAKRFYGDAFGWKFTDYGPDYCGIQRGPGQGEGEVGGMSQAGEVPGGGPLVVLYSSDLEGSVRAVREAGGVIALEPFDFPGGRRFHFKDPSGNELAVWSEAQD